MITDSQLEQLLRDEYDRYPEPDPALVACLAETDEAPAGNASRPRVPQVVSGDATPVPVTRTPSRARSRGVLVAIALLAPLVVAVLLVVGRHGTADNSLGGTPTSPVESSDLARAMAGSWVLGDLEQATPPYSTLPAVNLNANGTWTGSDGCNTLNGNWHVSEDGLFAATSGPTTRIGCRRVDYGAMLTGAVRADVAGGLLTLYDASGKTSPLIRDERTLPDVPAPGWLPGYSAFGQDNVVTDPKLIERFTALGNAVAQNQAAVGGRAPTPGPSVAWYLGRALGMDTYLIAFRSGLICTDSMNVKLGRPAGGGCTSRAYLLDPLHTSSAGGGWLAADAVRSLVITSADGVPHEQKIRDNFATGTETGTPKHVTVTLDDGRSLDLLGGGTVTPPTLTTPHTSTAVDANTRIYVGVACSQPNSVRCGRVGVAVWPDAKVDDLKAEIGPYVVALHKSGDHYEAFVETADLTVPPFAIQASDAGRWIGDPPAVVDVHITGSAADGPVDVTLRADVAAGWG